MKFQRNLPVLAVAVPETPAQAPVSYVESDLGTASEGGNGLSIKQVLTIVLAHKKMSIAIFFLILIPVALITKFLLTASYSATATLMVDYQMENPLATVGVGNANGAMMGNYMSTRVQLMQSAEVLIPVIRKLKLTEDKEFTAGFRTIPGANNDDALEHYTMDSLWKNLDIQPGAAGSQLLNVTASSRNPVLAADIANTLSEVYAQQELSRQIGPASERAQRYAEDLAELKNKVSVAQEQVTAFRQRTGVSADMAAQTNVETELLNNLERDYLLVQNKRRAEEVKAEGDQASSSTFIGSQSAQGLRATIATLEQQLAQRSATLGSEHPKVLELQSQLAAARASLQQELRNYSTGTGSDLSSSRQLEGKLKAAIEAQRAKVLEVRKLQDEGTKYALELESAQTVYKRALDGYDQIMFGASGHSTNVSFVSRATPPLRASKPNKVKIMLMALLGALAAAVVGPLGYELLVNRRVRCADDIERSFEIPVLIELDPLPEAGAA